MIAVDTNILVYAHRRDSPFHAEADAQLTRLAEGRLSWAIPWPCVHEFLAIVTHPRIYDPPSTMKQAISQVDAWIASPTLSLLREPATYWDTLKGLLGSARVAGPMVHDARIAAICSSHGVQELLSADRDFGRFGSLRIRNPLIDA